MAVKTKTKTTRKKADAPVDKKTTPKIKKSVISADEFAQFVGKRAYFIWQEQGQPQGNDFNIWLQAELDIAAQYSKK
ncbi:MAG: DUF2934 domain-containing protein [Candidatus Omnitrophica bacterium]|nr:DUF2934 domain-containing protein [Candidatus Omnitrophota bacterium]MBU4479306.1 DUF2934 domain-containing protein [Candidatus Omnitrophota bacterium]MCG2704015.1 DUF2934 domain-containing protein [Candidatus Omnitrophota bacterium]